jgi:glycosyltransferase involved in cell wall biosynthesis
MNSTLPQSSVHSVADSGLRNLQRQPGSLYLVLPVPFRLEGGKILVEAQAANGLDRWADNFSHILVAAPAIPEAEAGKLAGFVWRDIDTLEHRARITPHPLPWAYTPRTFASHILSTRKLMAASIAQSQHLQFAIGGLVGDWAAIAALEAIRQRRRYAIHTDRVEHELIRKTTAGSSPLRRLKVIIEAPLMRLYHRFVIRHCSLGLWHGDDCFRAYAGWAKESHLIHDVHTTPSDLIDDAALTHKIEAVRITPTLRLIYAGRLDPMKAPLEWLRTIAAARDLGADVEAIWLGEGDLLDEARSEAARLNLTQIVQFPGFSADRAALLECIRSAHALVFTHITPESPRILLEALVCGTPVLGYDNPYAVNLLEAHGGGALVAIHDTEALGRLIARLAIDRTRLATLTEQAAQNGRRFTDAGVFAERSALIQRFA